MQYYECPVGGTVWKCALFLTFVQSSHPAALYDTRLCPLSNVAVLIVWLNNTTYEPTKWPHAFRDKIYILSDLDGDNYIILYITTSAWFETRTCRLSKTFIICLSGYLYFWCHLNAALIIFKQQTSVSCQLLKLDSLIDRHFRPFSPTRTFSRTISKNPGTFTLEESCLG